MPATVLSANPDSGFTYNATILSKDGTNSEVAKTQHRRIREEGTIILSNPPKTYKVTHSINSGIWHLVLDDPHAEEDPIIIATKPKWYRNSITLEMGGEVYEFVRPSFRRDYIVGRVPKNEAADGVADNNKGKKKKSHELSGTQIGELRTDGSLKRSYTITFDDDVPVELPLFCYWLVSLLNKRGNSSNGGAGASGGGGGC